MTSAPRARSELPASSLLTGSAERRSKRSGACEGQDARRGEHARRARPVVPGWSARGAFGVAILVAATTCACSKSKEKPTVTTQTDEPAPADIVPAPPTPAPAPAPSPAPIPAAIEDDGPPTSGPRLVREPVAVDAVSLGSVPMGIGIPPGGPAPSGTAFDENGKPQSFGKMLQEQAPLLLVFVRGGWDPYANFQVRELAKAQPELMRRGVHTVVVTADRPAEVKKTKQSYGVPFPLLSDQELVLHNAYRVVHQADERELKSLGRMGADIEAMSGRKHHGFAVPAFYLIAKDGKVQWSHASEDERTQPKLSQIFGAWDARNLPLDVTP